ncbi:hypothetical protein MXB_3269, partial [Myxobolus squamalis]
MYTEIVNLRTRHSNMILGSFIENYLQDSTTQICGSFHPCFNQFLIPSKPKQIYIWKRIRHSKIVTDIKFSFDGMQMFSVSGDKSIIVSDFESNKCTKNIVSFVNVLSAIFSTGGRDGKIKVWDTRLNCKNNTLCSISVFSDVISKENNRKRTRIARKPPPAIISKIHYLFDDLNVLVSSSQTDPYFYLWDFRKINVVNISRGHSSPLTKGVYKGPSKMMNIGYKLGYTCLGSDQNHLYVGCVDNRIYCYEINKLYHGLYSKFDKFNEPDNLSIPEGGKRQAYFANFDISPDRQYLATGMFHDGVYIWNLSNKSKPVAFLKNCSHSYITFCYFSYDREP